ncbi:MAG: hypothetical protein HZB22_02935 [Deltaproteobacteria bacterium]|nr:hypothetical protein [Deltaproteobacteria bacterium]
MVKLKYPEVLFAKDDAEKLPYVLRDEFSFGIVRAGNGGKRLFGEEALQALREVEERRFQPPNIQTLLKTAQTLQKALESRPGASQAKLARELGITRARMTQILNLLNLSPEIQDYILSMPPVNGKSPISERSLRQIALMESRRKQVEMFRLLVKSCSNITVPRAMNVPERP